MRLEGRMLMLAWLRGAASGRSGRKGYCE